jgi:hypothetical protein
MSGDSDRPYQVTWSQSVGDQLRALKAQAHELGLEASFSEGVRVIRERLQWSPLVSGEPLYHLPAMQLQVRVCAHRILSVRYAVDEEKRIVYVLGGALLGGQGPS